jgi:MFS family permease
VRRFGLYAGGFLGPFGGGIIAVLIPQLRDAFDASTAEVTWGITAYLIPFAAFQLVSGTIGERFGIARTVRVGYVAYGVLSWPPRSHPPSRCSWACGRCRARRTRSSPRC